MRHHQLPQTSQLQQLADQICTQNLLRMTHRHRWCWYTPKIRMGLASPETQQATCERASPHFSYRSRRSAPEGCPGGRERRKEEGWRSFGLIWIVQRIQMSHVLVTDHLVEPRWAEWMSCDAKDAPYSWDRGSGCCGSVWASRLLQVTLDEKHTQPWWVMQALRLTPTPHLLVWVCHTFHTSLLSSHRLQVSTRWALTIGYQLGSGTGDLQLCLEHCQT